MRISVSKRGASKEGSVDGGVGGGGEKEGGGGEKMSGGRRRPDGLEISGITVIESVVADEKVGEEVDGHVAVERRETRSGSAGWVGELKASSTAPHQSSSSGRANRLWR